MILNASTTLISRPQPRQRELVFLLVLLSVATVLALVAWSAHADRTQRLQQLERDARNLAMSMGVLIGDRLKRVDDDLLRLRAALADRNGASEQGDVAPALQWIGADGRWMGGAAPVQLVGAELNAMLAFHRSSPRDALWVGSVQASAFDGQPMLPASRGVRLADGTFKGAVVGALPLEDVENLLEQVQLGSQGALGLSDREGQVLARWPAVQGTTGRFGVRWESRMGVSAEDGGTSQTSLAVQTFEARSPADGVDRFYAMTAVGPRLLVTVGIGIGEYLAPWWRHMAGLASLVMLAAGIAIALSTRLRGVLKHEVRMRRSLEDLTFDLQNLRQAIDLHAMVSITDESGHFIRANAKFCEVMHLPEQALLGRHQRIFHSGVHPRAFFDEIRTQLQDKGVFHGSLCERDRLGQLHWFDITTVAVRDSSDGAGRLISLRTDVSASRKVVQRLQRSLDVTQASKDAMDEAAHTDALTSLPNRRAFDEAATRLLRKSRDENLPAALLLLDVDWFKKYNDTLGHAAGDEALREVAGALKGALRRAGDQVYRYGGEEFAVLVAASAEADVWSIAQSLRVAVANMGLSHPVHPEGKVTVSMGYRIIRGASTPASVEAWIESADRALYKAKRDGRNRCVQAEDAEAGSGS